MTKKLKEFIKKNPEPARGTVGVNPMDPWSAKSNLAESALDQYLLARGIDPKFVSTQTKISHAKSSAFLKWKQDHQFESTVMEETDQKDMVCFDIPLLIRVLEFTREDMKTDIELHNMVERLINMRETYPLTMKEYDTITSNLVKENHIAIAMGKMLDDESGMVLTQIEELERGCAMIRSYIGKDYEKQLPAWVQAKITLATDYMSTVGNYLVNKNEKVNEEVLDEAKKPRTTALEKWRKAAAEREKKHNTVPMGDMKGAIDKLEKHLNKEEIELKEGEHLPGHPMYKSDISLYRKTPKSVTKKYATHSAKYFSNTDGVNYKPTDKEAPRYRNEEIEVDEQINEVLGKDASAGDWIHDFIHSNNPKFAGKSKAERKKMALGAYYGKQNEEVEQIDEITQSDLDKSAEQEVAHAKKNGWKVQKQTYGRTYTHPKHGHIDMDRYGEWQHRPASGISRGKGNLIAHGEFKDLDKHISSLKEELEQIDELKKSTVFSWLKQQPVVPEKKPGMSKKDHNKKIKTSSKSWNRALDRLSGYKPTSEDVFQDSQASTQTVFDGANNTNDTSPSRKSQMSKSARMIKALYKKKGVVKEDMTDWEKEDKSVQSYGKKPKLQEPKESNVVGEKTPDARIVMSGGTTLTGEKRDTVEIDPSMKKRPGPDTFGATGKKASQQ